MVQDSYRNRLFIQFSDGECYFGKFYLYVDSESNYDWCWSKETFMTSLSGVKFIKPEGSKFIYSVSAIVKFCDIEESQFEAYKRDGKIEQILN